MPPTNYPGRKPAVPNITKAPPPKDNKWNKPAAGDSPVAGDTLRGMLTSPQALARIKAVATKHLTPERLTNIALSVINAPAKGKMRLLDCTPMSLLQSVVNLAEVGLEPGGALAHAYLVPYRDGDSGRLLCRMQISYRGFIELARRSGQLAQIGARIVRDNDEFKLVYGYNPELHHVPLLKGDAGEPYVCYVYAKFKDGSDHVEHMSRDEIYVIRDRSEAYKGALKYDNKNTPWISDELEMWKKTVVKRASKYLPLSPEEKRAHELDDEGTLESEGGLDLGTRPFEVNPPAAKEEPEDAEFQEHPAEEPKLALPPEDAMDPYSLLMRGILTAKDQEEFDKRFVEANDNRKSMNAEEWSTVEEALKQREAELK